ncbi:hypothetical protein HY486_00035 [Candidatus Woesearchaeota archaeon]|nr:hypothetical protein [Candidatus Woesearchaeota archaeon]
MSYSVATVGVFAFVVFLLLFNLDSFTGFSVKGASKPVLADLTVTSVRFSPQRLVVGQSLDAVINVKNVGKADSKVKSHSRVTVFSGDSLYPTSDADFLVSDYVSVPPLKRGEEFSFSILNKGSLRAFYNFPATVAGVHSFSVSVDSKSVVKESNENNNIKRGIISILGN